MQTPPANMDFNSILAGLYEFENVCWINFEIVVGTWFAKRITASTYAAAPVWLREGGEAGSHNGV